MSDYLLEGIGDIIEERNNHQKIEQDNELPGIDDLFVNKSNLGSVLNSSEPVVMQLCDGTYATGYPYDHTFITIFFKTMPENHIVLTSEPVNLCNPFKAAHIKNVDAIRNFQKWLSETIYVQGSFPRFLAKILHTDEIVKISELPEYEKKDLTNNPPREIIGYVSKGIKGETVPIPLIISWKRPYSMIGGLLSNNQYDLTINKWNSVMPIASYSNRK